MYKIVLLLPVQSNAVIQQAKEKCVAVPGMELSVNILPNTPIPALVLLVIYGHKFMTEPEVSAP